MIKFYYLTNSRIIPKIYPTNSKRDIHLPADAPFALFKE